jgi:D-sedoheptulose 7-phosphate isomerase
MDVKKIKEYIKEGVDARLSVDPEFISKMGEDIAERMLNGNKLILFGNGGSAADAQHIAAEFVCRFEKDRKPMPALALHANTSSLTAIGNDYGYDLVYSRQVEAFAHKDDIVIGISTSGNSENVIKAIDKANELGCLTIVFTGKSGGKLAGKAKYILKVNSARTSVIQEVHIAVGHMISKIVEDRL